MFFSSIAQLAVIAASVYHVAAKPALSVPTSGTYRILNIGSGLWMDAFSSEQNDGTLVTTFTLNQPFTKNQEWALTVFDGQFATLQSITAFVSNSPIGPNTTGLGVTLSNEEESIFFLQPSPSGVNICIDPNGLGCLTSASSAGSQILIKPLVAGAFNQSWVFEPVGN